jgi:hypothetical protein
MNFLANVPVDAQQKLVARIFYEASRAKRRDEEDLMVQLLLLLPNAVETFSEATDKVWLSMVDPIARQGLLTHFIFPRMGPFRAIVRLTLDYYAARWLPTYYLEVPLQRQRCWTDEFVEMPSIQQITFYKPFQGEEMEIQPPVDSGYGKEEWLLAALRGMAHATADHRFAEALALGIRVVEKYGSASAPEEATRILDVFRCDVLGYLAVACAGLDLASPKTAFFCLKRMREVADIVSERNLLAATEVRVRELLRIDTTGGFYLARNNPLLVRSSEHFVEILFSHLRSLFRRAEDLCLLLLREYFRHSECTARAEADCDRMRSRIVPSLSAVVCLLLAYTSQYDMFARWHRDVQTRLTNYRILADVFCQFLANIKGDTQTFSPVKLEELAIQLKNLDSSTFDSPLLHVYKELCLDCVQRNNGAPGDGDNTPYAIRVEILAHAADQYADTYQTRSAANILTSGLIIHAFSRDLSAAAAANGGRFKFEVDSNLLELTRNANSGVPSSLFLSMHTDLRVSIFVDITTMLEKPQYFQHRAFPGNEVRAARPDQFWSLWKFPALTSEQKYQVDRNLPQHRNGLTDKERKFYADFMKLKTPKPTPTPTPATTTTTTTEAAVETRDERLVALIRFNQTLRKAELHGLERLGAKRHF